MFTTISLFRRPRSIVVATALFLSGCGGDGGGIEPLPESASIRVVVSTTGQGSDPDGYSVRVGDRVRAVAADDEVLFEGLEPGSHMVELNGVSPRCTVASDATIGVVAEAGQMADVSFQVECHLFREVACPDFSPETTSALPLEEIDIGWLPASFELPVAASVSVDGSGHDSFAFIRPEEESGGPLRLVAPLHPTDPLDGGTVTLTVADGMLSCAPFTFTIQGLPPAEGEFAAVLDQLQQILTGQASEFQTTPDDLRAGSVADLPQGLWPLAVAQRLLDDPLNDESLRNVAEGSRGGDVVTLLDRLMARADVLAALEEPEDSGTDTWVADSGAVSLTGPFPDASATQCLPTFVSGSEPLVLHECMSAAAKAQRRASGVAQRVADDIGTAFSNAGELKLPAADVAGEIFGQVFWVVQTLRERAAALYPSEFTAMTVEVDPAEILEDREVTGRVSRAEVTATNEGYDLQMEIIDAVSQALSLTETAEAFEISTGTFADTVVSELMPLVERAIRGAEIDALKVSPQTFGPVNVNDPEWIQLRVVSGPAVEVVDGTLTYKPRRRGSSVLSGRTFDGKFGGEQIARQAEVTIPAIELSLVPDDTTVAPRDPENPQVVSFRVEVRKSAHPDSVDVDLSEHPEQGIADIRRSEEGSVHFVDYLAPTDPDFGRSDLVVVKHTAQGGARAGGASRTGTATVDFGDITIVPAGGCVEPGEPMEFEAEVVGPEDDVVGWSADVGVIDDQGLYTAPSPAPTSGTATITARSTSFPSLNDQVQVRIGGCTCWWSVTVEGRTVENSTSDGAEFQYPAQGLVEVELLESGGGFLRAVPGGENGLTPLAEGTTGTFAAGAEGTIASGTAVGYAGGAAEAGFPVSITLTRNQADRVEGTIEGLVKLIEPNGDERSVVLNASFGLTAQSVHDADPTSFQCTAGG